MEELRSASLLSSSLGVLSIRCTLMRGGTSRGVFFNAADMPADPGERDRVLIAALGSPHPLQVDGVGGGNPLTSKVAIVGPSDDPRADVDYLFAQVSPELTTVDTNATCGNILSAVGPFAVEEGIVQPGSPNTQIRIRNTNSGTITLATLETPGGRLRYDGDERMAGRIRPAAPIRLSILEAAGALTGQLLPTGKARENIGGVDVSLVDFAIPVMIAEARQFGLAGDETAEQIDANRALFEAVEAIRLEAGRRMGLGDVSGSVVPKVALVSPQRKGGTITSRYLTPWRCHLTHAVTGGLCLSAAIGIEGTIANAIVCPEGDAKRLVTIEHPTGVFEVECEGAGVEFTTSVTRTARLLFRGHVYIPTAAVEDCGVTGQRSE
jgi:2-methylaconitate cis-trans-isomerase PrpF